VDITNDTGLIDRITVHLAYAETVQLQHYVSLEMPVNSTLYDALSQAGWLDMFADLALWCEEVIDIETPATKLWHVGIYSQKQPLNYRLQPQDRIEVYRSLKADPMSQRKSKSQTKR
jgi:putative ubiquitin-RnfH superfamily antitoxin RatB of RatAB toxin-antitoxin module